MVLIKKVESKVSISKTGVKRSRGQGLFLCPVCNSTDVLLIQNGTKAKSCNKQECKVVVSNSTKHGMRKTKIYSIWANMKDRCSNPRASNYSRYGGRGINYCQSWESFESFYSDMNHSYKDGLQLDRIDNNGNYCKENCQWLTAGQHSAKDHNRPVAQLDKDGTILNMFPSIKIAGEALGSPSSHIGEVCRGKRNIACGFGWKYTTEPHTQEVPAMAN